MSNITGPMIALTSPLNDYVLQCNLTWTHLGDAITRTATLVNSWLPGAAPRGRFSPGIQEPIWLSLETFQRTIADLCIPNSYTEATLVTLASGGITDFATVALPPPPPPGAALHGTQKPNRDGAGNLLFKGSVPALAKPLNDYFIEGVMLCQDLAIQRVGVTLLNSGNDQTPVQGCYDQNLDRVYARLSNRMFGEVKNKLQREGESAEITIIANRDGVVVELSI